jgi:uncharacterized surface protein with fasciclin (FAS1) repeats
MKFLYLLPVSALLVLAAPTLAGDGCAKSCSASLAGDASKKSDIVATATAAGSFNTLAAALKAADLVSTLQGEGPFTVFAPSDEAFAKLPRETLADLLKPENKRKLAAILTYHVVPGKVLAADVVKLKHAGTVNGQRVDVRVVEGGVTIDAANVVKTDIVCSNGVIHVLDSVILPSTKNLVETAQGAGTFGTLIAAAKAAGLADTLAKGGPFTVLAPTDEAFAKLPAGTVENLLKPENKERLAAILKLHVAEGRVYADQVVTLAQVPTLAGRGVAVTAKRDSVQVGQAKVVQTDIEATNGVIHVIDTVILPE